MARVSFIYDIFDKEKSVVNANAGECLRDIIQHQVDSIDDAELTEVYNSETDTTEYKVIDSDVYKVIAIVNGEERPLDYFVSDNDMVTVLFAPLGENAGAVAGVIIGMTALLAGFGMVGFGLAAEGGILWAGVNTGIVTMGIGAAAMAFAMKELNGNKSGKDAGETESLPYINGASNQSQIGNKYLTTLGRHLIAPRVVGSPWHETVTEDFDNARDLGQWQHVLYCAGYGPLKLTDFKLGNLYLAYNRSSETADRDTIIHGQLRTVEEDGDKGEITVKWKNNDVKLEILQAGSLIKNATGMGDSEKDIYGTVYPETVIENQVNSKVLYLYDKAVGDLTPVVYYNRSIPNGYRTNTVRFSSSCPRKIQVELDFSSGYFETYTVTSGDSSSVYYKKMPLCFAVQWRYARNGQASSNAEKGDGWTSFQKMIFKNGEVSPRPYSTNDRHLEILENKGLTPNTSEDYNNGWLGHNVFSLSNEPQYVKMTDQEILDAMLAGKISSDGTELVKIYGRTIVVHPGTQNIEYPYVKTEEKEKEQEHYVINAGYEGEYVIIDEEPYKVVNTDLEPKTKDDYNVSERRYVFEYDFSDDEIQKMLNIGTDGTYRDNVEIRVIRITPCYLDETSKSESAKSTATYQDLTTWTYTRTWTFDKTKYKTAYDNGEEPTIADSKYYERPQPIQSDLDDFVYIALSMKQDVNDSAGKSFSELTCVSESFNPKYNAEENKWYPLPEELTDGWKYCYKEKIENEWVFTDSLTEEEYKQHVITDQIHYFKKKTGNNFTDLIRRELFVGSNIQTSDTTFRVKVSNIENRYVVEWYEGANLRTTTACATLYIQHQEGGQFESVGHAFSDTGKFVINIENPGDVHEVSVKISSEANGEGILYIETTGTDQIKSGNEIRITPMVNLTLPDSMQRKYIGSNTASILLLGVLGKHLNEDSKTYNAFNMNSITDLYKFCEDITDGTNQVDPLIENGLNTVLNLTASDRFHLAADFISAGWNGTDGELFDGDYGTFWAKTYYDNDSQPAKAWVVSRVLNGGIILPPSQESQLESALRNGTTFTYTTGGNTYTLPDDCVAATFEGAGCEDYAERYCRVEHWLGDLFYRDRYQGWIEHPEDFPDRWDFITAQKCLEKLKETPINALLSGINNDSLYELMEHVYDIEDGKYIRPRREWINMFLSYMHQSVNNTSSECPYCKAPDGLLHVRLECNGVLDNDIKVEDLMYKIALTGRSFIKRSEGNKYEVLIGRPEPYPVGMLNQRTCISRSNTKNMAECPSGFQIQIIDEADNWGNVDFYIMDNGEDYTDPNGRIEPFKIDWVTNKFQMALLARFNYACRKYQVESYSATVGMSGYSYSVGDVLLLQDDTILVGTDRGGRIIEILEDDDYIYGFTTDEVMDFKNEKEDGVCTQGCIIMQPDKRGSSRCVTVRFKLAGEPVTVGDETYYMTEGLTNFFLFQYPIIKATETPTLDMIEGQYCYIKPKIDDAVGFGYVGSMVSKAVIMSIKPKDKDQFDLSLSPYNDALYNAGEGFPIFNDNITTPDRSEDYDFNTNVTVDEMMERTGDTLNTIQSSFDLSTYICESTGVQGGDVSLKVFKDGTIVSGTLYYSFMYGVGSDAAETPGPDGVIVNGNATITNIPSEANKFIIRIYSNSARTDLLCTSFLSYGKEGAVGGSFWLIEDVNSIRRESTGTLTNTSVTYTAKTQNQNGINNYNGRFKIYYTTDGVNYILAYSSSSDESSHTYDSFSTIDGLKAIKSELYLAGGFTTLLDSDVIQIISDGVDGQNAIVMTSPTTPSGTYNGQVGIYNTQLYIWNGSDWVVQDSVLPTDPILHYSFDEVPDLPDTTPSWKLENMHYTGYSSGYTNPIAGHTYLFKVKGKATRDFIAVFFFTSDWGHSERFSIYNDGRNQEVWLTYTVPSTWTGIMFQLYDQDNTTGVHDWTVEYCYLYDLTSQTLSYNTPVIDNANGQYNATNNGGLATQGVCGKGVKLLNGKYLNIVNYNIPNTFTVSIWVKPENNNTGLTQNIISKGGHFILRNGTSWGTYSQLYIYTGNNVETFLNIGSLLPVEWNHIVITRNGTTVKVFRNGILTGTYTVPSDNIVTNSGNMYVGTSGDTRGQELDDFQIFSRALSDKEVLGLYLARGNTPKQYTESDYRFDCIDNDGIITPSEKKTLLSKWLEIYNQKNVTSALTYNTSDNTSGEYVAHIKSANSSSKGASVTQVANYINATNSIRNAMWGTNGILLDMASNSNVNAGDIDSLYATYGKCKEDLEFICRNDITYSSTYYTAADYLGPYSDAPYANQYHAKDFWLCSLTHSKGGYSYEIGFIYYKDNAADRWLKDTDLSSHRYIQAMDDLLELGAETGDFKFITNIMAQMLVVGKCIKSSNFDGNIDSQGKITSEGTTGFAFDKYGKIVASEGRFRAGLGELIYLDRIGPGQTRTFNLYPEDFGEYLYLDIDIFVEKYSSPTSMTGSNTKIGKIETAKATVNAKPGFRIINFEVYGSNYGGSYFKGEEVSLIANSMSNPDTYYFYIEITERTNNFYLDVYLNVVKKK